MSGGRGRGSNMRQPHDNNRRELRRPMGGDEELARGIGRMDPFGYGGQYGGGGGGGRYGIQNQFEPPRPAPNADGWSSGDDYLTWNDQQQQQQQQQQPQHHHPRDDHFGQNSHQHNQYRTPAQSRLHYNQQQYQQQRQQQQQWNMAAQPQWNLGASEFVPKSNLSVSAEEFVPRTVPRNTSQWAYQQQQQQPQQPQQPQDYNAGGYGYQPYQAYGGGGGGGGSNSSYEAASAPGNSTVYDPSEILSDAIATVVFMPSKYDRTTIQLAEKFNGIIDDVTSMSNLVDSLVEQCLKEEQFATLAGKFCAYLAQHVTVENEGQTLKSLLLKKLDALSSQCVSILAANEKRVHSILSLLVDIYLQLVVVSDSVHKWKTHDANLGSNVTHILNILFNNGSLSNVQVAAQKLKLCGQTLEGEEKYATVSADSQTDESTIWSETPAPKMDALMSVVATLSANSGLPDDLKKDLNSLVDTRSNEKWASAEADNLKAKEEAARALSKPAPRKSAAIKIEPDPNDVKTKTPAQVPITVTGGGELTEEEMKFMADAIGNEDNSDDGENDLEEAEFGGMTEDIADAYEQFLAEQSKNGGP